MDDLIAQLNKLSKERLEQEREQIKEKEKKRDEKAADGKKKKNPQTGHGPREQPALPLVEEIHEFAPDDRRCTICGQEMDPLGDQFEEYEEIDYVELQYQRKLVKRRKMRCSCNACVRTAPGPPRLIRGGRYSVDFAIHVAINKYADHLPLERQCRRMARYGLIVPSQTLWDQIYALARILGPTYEALGWEVLKSDLLYVDETRWFDLSKGATSPWTVWTRSTEKIAHYTILSKKNTRVAKRLFKDFSGTLVVDGYTVYEKLVAEDEANTLRLVNCWAHVLRKFRDIKDDYPISCDEILALIGKLYKIERKVPGPFPGDAQARALRAELRDKESKPILAEIEAWAKVQDGLKRSDFGTAVRYMYKRMEALKRFADDPRIPLDNNHAERTLRGPVVGRKNHYGSKSRKGTKVAALFYTLVETAILHDVNPALYLKIVVERALADPGAVTFPWEIEGILAGDSGRASPSAPAT